jgi:hypothetical protein
MMPVALESNIPIEELELVRAEYRNKGIRIRVRYRGPRHDAMRLYCLKRNARAFSVYPL